MNSTFTICPASTGEISVPAPLSPPGRRAPFGWQCLPIPSPGCGTLTLRWPPLPNQGGAAVLRITTALDDRELKRIAVRTTTGRFIGEFDLRYAHALETFSLALTPVSDSADGLVLEMTTGTTPLWIVAPETADRSPGLSPHLLLVHDSAAERWRALLHHLRSPDCQHTWGWMEGCVLDGLERLHTVEPSAGFDAALRLHLKRFFTDDGRLLVETPRSEAHDGAIDNIESTLMFAPLAGLEPHHPWLDRVVTFWRELLQLDGSVIDGGMLSAEGSYTIAYPMARLARLRNDPSLATAAFRQLEIRRERLWHEGRLCLRWMPADGTRTFANWARGVTWHFLGSVRLAEELRGDPRLAPVMADLRALSHLALAHQRPDGLWNCFIDDAHGTPDTSGSAGLAAALALCARHGWMDTEPSRAAAVRTWAALPAYITPDGRLGGVAQGNRGGEALQRSDYRVLSAMGAGLAAQLYSALHSPSAS